MKKNTHPEWTGTEILEINNDNLNEFLRLLFGEQVAKNSKLMVFPFKRKFRAWLNTHMRRPSGTKKGPGPG